MLIFYLRNLTGVERSVKADIHLGLSLAFIAGAMNAGGFLAVQQYTSHMTGIVSSMADGLAIGNFNLVLASVGAMVCFMVGAGLTEVMVNWARGKRLQSEYALPLIFEAVLLLCFGFMGGKLHRHMGLFVSMTVMLLCFLMGLQNAIITRISRAVIRTTHMTGIVTDIGIELGTLFYWNRKVDKEDEAYVKANRGKLYLLSGLLVMFFLGGTIGAFGFKWIGYLATFPLAGALIILAIIPVFDDIRRFFR